MVNGIIPLSPAQAAAKEKSALREKYPVRVLIALDQFANVLAGGHPDETLSSRAARAAEKGKWWGILGAKALDLFQRDHGAMAQAGDVARAIKVAKVEEHSGGLEK